jgi:hypothetical protein
LLLCAVLPLWACFITRDEVHGHDSTETGNPPAIDKSLVSLVVVDGEVHVKGEQGAASDASEVEVKVLGSDDATRGPVDEDGAFDVQVDGATLNDAFEVRALGDGERSAPVFVTPEVAATGEGDGGQLSCEQRTELAYPPIARIAAEADTSCASDDDCVYASLDTVCRVSCLDIAVSRAGQTEVEAVTRAVDVGVCGTFAEDGCARLQPPCPSGPMDRTLVCLQGQCQQPANADLRAMLAQSRATFEQLLADSGESAYSYEEENCALNAPTGTVTLVQVEGTAARLVQTSMIDRSECTGSLNRLGDFTPRTLLELYDECDDLLGREPDAQLTFDDLGVVQSCSVDLSGPECQDACGVGFFIQSWMPGILILP